MKIVKLEAENFKRLKAVEIRPDGSIVEIRGRNGAGKTSVLDSIAAAIGGEKLCPSQPIRRGADRARVAVELDEDLVIERRWTAAGGSKLEVRSKNGLRHPSPQKLLDTLVGKLTFDPLAFQREAPARQAEIVQQLAGIDFRLLDEKRRKAYDARTHANRQVTQLKARLGATPVIEVTPDCPAEPISGADLLEEQRRREEVKRANDVERGALQIAIGQFKLRKDTAAAAARRVADLEAQLAHAREEHAAAAEAVRAQAEHGKKLQDAVAALVDPDLDEIPRKLREVETVNRLVQLRKEREALARELAGAEEEAKRFDFEIAQVDAQKAGALEDAKLPIEGLGFTEQGVTLDGLPLEQASQAEQLRVSLAMGAALNPKFRVLLVRDASLLDERSLRLVAEFAEKQGMQVWLEVVGQGGVGVVIEDGQVQGAPAPAEAARRA